LKDIYLGISLKYLQKYQVCLGFLLRKSTS
jgi:hypothetical protein